MFWIDSEQGFFHRSVLLSQLRKSCYALMFQCYFWRPLMTWSCTIVNSNLMSVQDYPRWTHWCFSLYFEWKRRVTFFKSNQFGKSINSTGPFKLWKSTVFVRIYLKLGFPDITKSTSAKDIDACTFWTLIVNIYDFL